MKKIKLLMVIAAALILTACGTSEKNTSGKTAKGTAAELSIIGGSFIQPLGGDSDGEEDVLVLDVNVKNTSTESFYLFEDTFYLVEKGESEKIKSLSLNYENGLEEMYGDLSPGKSLTGKVVFSVDPAKEYQLIFKSGAFTEKGQSYADVEVPLDLAKYTDSKADLEQPVAALQAYIDVVLLQLDNPDYEKLVANDLEAERKLILKEYSNELKDLFYSYRLTEADLNKGFESYVGNQSEAVELELELLGNVGDRGKVSVDFKGISEQAVRDLIEEYEDEYDDKNNNYDSEKREKYAFNKLEEIYSIADVGEPRETIEVTLTKKDDKWKVDLKSKDFYENSYLLEAFLGNVD